MFVPPGMLCLIFVDASACRNPVRRWIYSGVGESELNSVTSSAYLGNHRSYSFIHTKSARGPYFGSGGRSVESRTCEIVVSSTALGEAVLSEAELRALSRSGSPPP